MEAPENKENDDMYFLINVHLLINAIVDTIAQNVKLTERKAITFW